MNFTLATLERERQALIDADEIYVLGWSMPSTDANQEDFIRRAIEAGSRRVRHLTVVNSGAGREYFDRVASVFGRGGRISVHNRGFRMFATEP